MTKEGFMFSTMIFAAFLQIGDGISTYIVLTFIDSSMEANPLLNYIFSLIGLVCGLLLVKSAAILLTLFLYSRRNSIDKKPFLKIACVLVILVYVVININNWHMVYRIMTA